MFEREPRWLLLILVLGASCGCEPLDKVKVLEADPPGPAIVVFRIRAEVPEDELHAKMDAAGRELFPAHPYVEIYAFYDKAFARRFAADDTLKKIMDTGITPGAVILESADLQIKGGAFLAISLENREGVWVMVERH